MNREYDADFDQDAFVQRLVWDAEGSRIEMHLISLYPQVVSIGHSMLEFRAGETIHTEISYKYAPERVALLAQESRWRMTKSWVSDSPEFAIYLVGLTGLHSGGRVPVIHSRTSGLRSSI